MSSDQEVAEQPGPMFYVLKHNPFQTEEEAATSSQVENLMYHVPKVLPDTTEHFLNAVISLYMYMKVCMEDSLVEINMKDCKVAVQNFKIPDSAEEIFFILRVPVNYSGYTTVDLLNYIVDGLYFVLGPFSCTNLGEYLSEHGSSIIDPIISSCSDAFTAAFETVSHVIWQRATVLSSLASIIAMDEQSSISAIACFVNERLVTSMIDITVARYFKFAVADQTTVHLTEAIRAKINKPDLETSILTRVSHENATFYVLSETELDQKIVNALTYAAKGIKVQKTLAKEMTKEVMYYDEKLKAMKISESADACDAFKENMVYCHDEFSKDARLQEVLIKHSDRIFYSGRFLSMQCFSTVADNGKSIIELYREVISQDPHIKKYLDRLLSQ